MTHRRQEIEIGGKPMTIETGAIAKQADGAVTVRYGDTLILVTAVAAKTPREGVDFLPLTVDYRENNYAAGKIPGGFFRREGRPNEKEILTCRVIDRPLRPLFPKGWRCETQVISLLLSSDQANDSDVLAIQDLLRKYVDALLQTQQYDEVEKVIILSAVASLKKNFVKVLPVHAAAA